MPIESSKSAISMNEMATQIQSGKLEICEISPETVCNINNPETNKSAFAALIKSISDNKTITEFKLNNIKDPEVFTKTLEALETNKSLTSLDLRGLELRNFQPLFTLLKNNKNIKHLNIENTKISKTDINNLFENNGQLYIEEFKETPTDQNKLAIQQFIIEQNSVKFLKSINYPEVEFNVSLQGPNLPEVLMKLIVEYLVSFNDNVKKQLKDHNLLTDETSKDRNSPSIKADSPSSTISNATLDLSDSPTRPRRADFTK